MRRIALISLSVFLIFSVGCGESPDPQADSGSTTGGSVATSNNTTPDFQPERPAKQYSGPRAAVNDFLIAVTQGDEKAATALLTTEAQREAWTNGMAISGDGFPNARFAIKEFTYLGDDQSESHVLTEWENDSEYGGTQRKFQCVWMLRAEPHGWCIYGMATKLEMLSTPKPLVLNFEDQSEMQKRQEWAQKEIERDALMREQQAQARQQQQQQPAAQVPTRQAAVPSQNVRQ